MDIVHRRHLITATPTAAAAAHRLMILCRSTIRLLFGGHEMTEIIGGFDTDHFGFLGVGEVDVDAVGCGHHLDG